MSWPGCFPAKKFAAHLAARGLTPNGIMRGYAAVARTVAASVIARTVPADADDEAMIIVPANRFPSALR